MNISSGDSLALLIRYSTRVHRLNLCAMYGVYGLSSALLLLKAVNLAFLLCLNASTMLTIYPGHSRYHALNVQNSTV